MGGAFTYQPIIKPNTLDLLDDEERKIVQWIEEWRENPEAHGGFLETLQDAGWDIITDLLTFLERYNAAYNKLRADQFLAGS